MVVITASIAHSKVAFARTSLNAPDSSSPSRTRRGGGYGGGDGGWDIGDGGIDGGGVRVVSASLAADVASTVSATKNSELEMSIPGISPSSSVGSVSVDVAVTPPEARLRSAAASVVSVTVAGFMGTVTSYAVSVTSRRLLCVLTSASHAPKLASIFI